MCLTVSVAVLQSSLKLLTPFTGSFKSYIHGCFISVFKVLFYNNLDGLVGEVHNVWPSSERINWCWGRCGAGAESAEQFRCIETERGRVCEKNKFQNKTKITYFGVNEFIQRYINKILKYSSGTLRRAVYRVPSIYNCFLLFKPICTTFTPKISLLAGKSFQTLTSERVKRQGFCSEKGKECAPGNQLALFGKLWSKTCPNPSRKTKKMRNFDRSIV